MIWNTSLYKTLFYSKKSLAIFFGYCVLIFYAAGLLSIGIANDWCLMHEDNGAMHTTLALSHLRLGLEETRAHDLFFNPKTGETSIYGHHPPATALILAGAFALTGSDSPFVARMVVILFHLGSLFLLIRLLQRFFSPALVLFGSFIMATLPMSAFFGRMVNYEPLCLFAVLLLLNGYSDFKHNNLTKGLVICSLGILFGGLIDWPLFFFVATIMGVEIWNALRHRSWSFSLLITLLVSSSIIFLFDLWHLWYANHESLIVLKNVVSQNEPLWQQKFTLWGFFNGRIETFRRYYTTTGLLACFFIPFCLICPFKFRSKKILKTFEDPLLKRLLIIMGLAPFGYVLAAPYWANTHHYWLFYFLPFVVFSILLILKIFWQKIFEGQPIIFSILLIIFMVEMICTSTYMLHLSHAKIRDFAVKASTWYRTNYLVPESFEEKQLLL